MSAADRARASAPATEEEAVAAAPPTEDVIATPKDNQRRKARFEAMRKVLAAQPKVKIRLAKDEVRGEDQVVTINGYSMTIKRGHTVEVPQGVAEVLEQAGLI